MSTAAETVAGGLGVHPAIHPEDDIFRFILSMPSITDEDDAVRHYLLSGDESAQKLSCLITDTMATTNVSLLEFASGYGCVTRHLGNHLPETEIVACDIHSAAVDFCESVLGVPAELSAHTPEELDLGRAFDVVFALSFFSHMPETTWRRWLRVLAAHTRAMGVLIFTTHGTESAKRIRNAVLDERGFWFAPASEQRDLASEEYGTTVTSFDYVYRQLVAVGALSLVQFRQAYWWGHQDLYVVRKNNAYPQ
ncbi:MAG: class I SAM-dependent methyltransferase [Actinomycetota bacterium]|nr:class I SAM-dependent methyltransferase [Actinomycetota bacterium]